MKWIILAILLAVVPYTIVTLKYRKEGPAFRPYEDMKNRANVSRLLAAGYQRIPLIAQRPADDTRPAGGAAVTTAPGGLPSDLKSTLVEIPQLPLEITSVVASPSTNQLQSYAIQFICTLADDKQHLGGAELYVRENSVVLVPTFEAVDGGLNIRSRNAIVLLTIPAGALKPGNYQLTLPATAASRTWPMEVR